MYNTSYWSYVHQLSDSEQGHHIAGLPIDFFLRCRDVAVQMGPAWCERRSRDEFHWEKPSI